MERRSREVNQTVGTARNRHCGAMKKAQDALESTMSKGLTATLQQHEHNKAGSSKNGCDLCVWLWHSKKHTPSLLPPAGTGFLGLLEGVS
jgi:hypothetical protein